MPRQMQRVPQSPGRQRPPSQDDEDFDDEDFVDEKGHFVDVPDNGMGFDGMGDDPRNVFTGDSNYNSAVSKQELARTRYTKKIKDYIGNTTLFPDTQSTLVIIAEGLFDATEVLAKTANLRLEEIDAQVIIAQAKMDFHPSDVDNASLSTTINLILKHYRQYLSRSANGWERGLQNQMESIQTSHMYQHAPQFEGRPQQQGTGGKKPWYRRWV